MDANPLEKERRNRIRVSLAALAYEIYNESIMPDGEYDALARSIDPAVETGHDVLDKFFETEFSPSTGMWIHNHPEFTKLVTLYESFYLNKTRP